MLRNRHFAGLARHIPLLQIRLIQTFGTDFLHGDGLLRAFHRSGHRLRALRLHGFHAFDATQRRRIVTGQTVGGQHLHIVQSLLTVKAACSQKGITATGVDAGQHGHTE